MSSPLSSRMKVSNALFQPSTNSKTSSLDRFKVWQVQNYGGTMHFPGKEFVKVIVQRLFASKLIWNILYFERIVMLGMHPFSPSGQKVHSEFEVMSILLFDDKENEPGKEIRKATWDPHSPTSLGNIRH